MDDEDVQMVRLALWALFAAAAVAAGRQPRNALSMTTASQYADDLLADATQRFPFLAEPAS